MGRGGIGAKAGSGSSIEITFVIQGIRFRERIKGEPTAANLRAAAKYKASIDVAIQNGNFDYAKAFPESKNRHRFKPPTARRTVAAYLSDYLVTVKPHLSTSTWDDYRKTIDNVYANSSLALVTLADLDRARIKAFCEDEMKCTNKRISNVLSVLRVALTAAVQNLDLQDNVLQGWSFKRVEPPKDTEDADPLNADEQRRVLENLKPQYASHFKFGFWTGCRTSEQVALLWSDIDFETGVIKITKAKTSKAKTAEKTKTPAGRREIKMLAPAREALQEQFKRTGAAGPAGRVWEIANYSAAWDIWTLALEKAGVRHRRPYQTRHTYASMMLTAGESVMWVAAQMGHADWGLIRRVYGRWIKGSDPGAGDAAVAMFSVAEPA